MDMITDLFNLLLPWELGIVDRLCLWVDLIIYKGVDAVYDIFFAIANVQIGNDFAGVSFIRERLFLIIGIFMIFRLAFSLLSYLIDPDKFTDSSTGFQKILKNVFISLALLVSINFIFEKIYDFQDIILDEKIVEKIVLGGQANVTNVENISMGTVLFSAFFGTPEGESCANSEDDGCTRYRATINSGLLGVQDSSITDYYNIVKSNDIVYYKGFSGLAGIFVFIMFLTYSIDVAVRIFKLLFYQIIAPIPIIMYIEPGKQDLLKNWIKKVISTFLDLFIRLALVYLAVVLISYVPGLFNDIDQNSAFQSLGGFSKSLAFFLIIVAILMFTKMVPNLLKDVTGFGGDDDYSINPFKKGLFAAGLGSAIGGATGGTIGTAMGLATGKGLKGKIAGAAMGAVGGTARGVTKGASAKGIVDTFSKTGQAAGTTRNAAISHAAAGGFGAYMGNAIRDVTGASSMAKTNLSGIEAKEGKLNNTVAATRAFEQMKSEKFEKHRGITKGDYMMQSLNEKNNALSEISTKKSEIENIKQQINSGLSSNLAFANSAEYRTLNQEMSQKQREVTELESQNYEMSDKEFIKLKGIEWEKQEAEFAKTIIDVDKELKYAYEQSVSAAASSGNSKIQDIEDVNKVFNEAVKQQAEMANDKKIQAQKAVAKKTNK